MAIANANVPNMVGQISTAMAKAGLNIHNMLNKSKGEMAYTLVDVDSAVPTKVIEQIGGIAGVLACAICRRGPIRNRGARSAPESFPGANASGMIRHIAPAGDSGSSPWPTSSGRSQADRRARRRGWSSCSTSARALAQRIGETEAGHRAYRPEREAQVLRRRALRATGARCRTPR